MNAHDATAPRPAPPSQEAGDASPARPPRPPKREVHGWVILDKPAGMTSTHAVARVKRAFAAKKAGHAGTLDPLATGCLPIALGEATKTVPFVMDGRKLYRFTVRWGVETDTDDAEGQPVATSDERPAAEAIRALLPRFTGTIEQVPPRFSAIKIAGERAYDLAREGQAVEIAPRTITVHRLALTTATTDEAVFEIECGKGAYVRALARDLGRALGCRGHVVQLRRTEVGPFAEAGLVPLDLIEAEGGPAPTALLPAEAALADLPALAVSRADAGRLRRGQPILLRGRDAPQFDGPVAIRAEGQLIAIADAAAGELVPRRVFNFAR
ncbi:MAG TPA: tRNA pseudouridine(55) synthase TruB [Hyphomicrobiales bacterium]|nr:tRNA pseudouridine(55) synthase TruB [Hyphomicrobiales bacterium]